MCGIQIKYTFGDKEEGEMAVLREDGGVCGGGGIAYCKFSFSLALPKGFLGFI